MDDFAQVISTVVALRLHFSALTCNDLTASDLDPRYPEIAEEYGFSASNVAGLSPTVSETR